MFLLLNLLSHIRQSLHMRQSLVHSYFFTRDSLRTGFRSIPCFYTQYSYWSTHPPTTHYTLLSLLALLFTRDSFWSIPYLHTIFVFFQSPSFHDETLLSSLTLLYTRNSFSSISYLLTIFLFAPSLSCLI